MGGSAFWTSVGKKHLIVFMLIPLMLALRRYGLTGPMLQMISSMLRARSFVVSGMSQGCTLSPLLLIIAMSVMMHDATSILSAAANKCYESGRLTDRVYADDTLLI
eukprot:12427015-Karenia_brevis.AAC.1